MRFFYELFGETLARRPGDVTERLTPWILTLVGGVFVALMLYGYLAAYAG